MKPLRIAHFSDTHLGYRAGTKVDQSGRNQRTIDVEQAFSEVVDEILARDVDMVIHSGDLFHHPRPDYHSIRFAIQQLQRLTEAGLPVLVIGGNHDTPRLRTTASVYSLLEVVLPAVWFVCGYDQDSQPLAGLDLTVTAVPHGKLIDPQPPAVFPSPNTRNILVTHGFLHGMTLHGHEREPGEEEIKEGLIQPGLDYVALGHYHLTEQPRTNAWYSGSTERFGWGDVTVSPGFLLVELGDPGATPLVEHLPVSARPMVKLNDLDATAYSDDAIIDHVLAELAELGEPSAMVRLDLVNASRTTRRVVDARLRQQAAHLAWQVEVRAARDGAAWGLLPSGERVMTDLHTMFNEFIASERELGQMTEPLASRFGDVGWTAIESARLQQLDPGEERTG